MFQAFNRIAAIATKELIHMVRDRMTFVSLLSVTIGYVIVFGYAINPDPRHIPTIVVDHDKSEFSRLYKAALQQSVYLEIDQRQLTSDQASEMLRKAQTSVVVEIPPDFTRNLMRGLPAQILVEADASDPAATGGAIAALSSLPRTALTRDLLGAAAKPGGDPFEVVIHRRYNPEAITAYNIVPGLLGVILSMTLVMMTALGVTREYERGTMESLLATPALAHKASDSYLSLQASGQHISGRWDIALRDLDQADWNPTAETLRKLGDWLFFQVTRAFAAMINRAIVVDPPRRTQLLRHLLATHGWERALVFVATKYAAEQVADKLRRAGLRAEPFHGQLSQGKRDQVLADLKASRVQVVVSVPGRERRHRRQERRA